MIETKLHALGIDYRYDSSFLIDRPNGSGDNLLIIFKSAARVEINGEFTSVSPDTAIVYDKFSLQKYGADGTDYINHWVHFDCSDDTAFLKRVNLPFETLINITDISSVESILTQLSVESVSEDYNKEECTDLLLKLLMAKLGGGADLNIRHSPHYNALCSLRADIYRSPAEYGSISDFANRLSLSPSHFQTLYKSEFGVSCFEDVITARIEKAKYFLLNTSLSVKKISELCGYENDVHFIRQFRQRTGMTSGEYRKINRF